MLFTLTHTHVETTTTDFASQTNALESQLQKMISTYEGWCQKLKQGSVPLAPSRADTPPIDLDCNEGLCMVTLVI